MNWVSRFAAVMALAGAALGYWLVEYRWVGVALSATAVPLLWYTREVSHRRNQRLRAQVVALESGVGHLEGGVERLESGVGHLGSEVQKNRPTVNVAAAIIGQGELATWNYAELVERMRRDGLIGRKGR